MDQDVTLWLFGILIGLQTTVLGAVVWAIWSHSHDCRDFRVKLAAMIADIGTRLTRIEMDIGTHDTGMRGDLHRLRNDVSPLITMERLRQERERRERGP
jgi:hypothetical protein